jgi:hypothetical protein
MHRIIEKICFCHLARFHSREPDFIVSHDIAGKRGCLSMKLLNQDAFHAQGCTRPSFLSDFVC